MKIPEWIPLKEQMAQLGCHRWSVMRLIALSSGFPVMDVPVDHLDVSKKYEKLSVREMVMHMKAMQDADLSCPIILDEDGEIMDGRHRIMKAILTGQKTIKAVRFDENPRPCEIEED